MIIRRPSLTIPRNKYVLGACGVIIIGGIAAGAYLISRPKTAALAPSYAIVLPQRTPVEDLGGWQRVSPAGSDPVFAYSDKVQDVAISVSQQPLPASFTNNVAASVKQLAESYSATTMIEAGGTQAYIGRSARGPQSVILAKGSTLILVKSEKTISQAEWIKYINSLVDPETEQTPTF